MGGGWVGVRNQTGKSRVWQREDEKEMEDKSNKEKRE